MSSRSGLGSDVALVDGEVFGEGADAVLPGFGVHLVAGRESAHPRTGLNHDAGQVVAQHDRSLSAGAVSVAVADLQIQWVHAGGVDLHEDVVVAQGGLGSFNGGDVVGLAVTGQRDPSSCRFLIGCGCRRCGVVGAQQGLVGLANGFLGMSPRTTIQVGRL